VGDLYATTKGRPNGFTGTVFDSRLVALKNKFDPTNFCRMNQNIKPNVR